MEQITATLQDLRRRTLAVRAGRSATARPDDGDRQGELKLSFSSSVWDDELFLVIDLYSAANPVHPRRTRRLVEAGRWTPRGT